ncbi:hypothetical protein [Psychromonas algicola]|jgi:hypothetical protein|uniref:hypothetical protein n=1 Tax=Psychromonas algicola TaxID=2555642 RepID=UPI001067BED9|nr:hypothetical protein [Psychromonas sp. RZ5]TEW46152.1 hypothetical protein E2R67_13365 [Psychromonas sp. RZ5]
MSKKVDMNVFLHFLLVIKQMNNFTVTEAKNTLLHEQPEFTDEIETRKFIYRQLTRSVDKGLLKRTNKLDGGVKKVIYSKTNLFFTVQVIPVTRGRKVKVTKEHSKETENIDYQKELKKELLAYEIDLNTLLEEAKEYKRLIARFPKLENRLQQHHTQAKENSIKLLGKVRALQNLLSNEITDQ